MSKYYRFINKNGGYTWVQSCATLVCSSNQNNSNSAPSKAPTPTPGANGSSANEEQEQCIIMINYVIR